MKDNRKKKKEGGPLDPWEDMAWVDDMPVYREKKERGRGVLTGKSKMIKFLSAKGQ